MEQFYLIVILRDYFRFKSKTISHCYYHYLIINNGCLGNVIVNTI